MYRCIHILACLTVLTTALPQRWCCWVVPSSCCTSASASTQLPSDGADSELQPARLAGLSISGAGLSISGSHCCQHQGTSAKNTVSDQNASAVTRVDTDLMEHIPVSRGSTGECCQRVPLVRAVSFDFLVNPLLALTSECQTLLGQPQSANLANVDISVSLDLIRRHARLGRWLI
jgi:hypothetical protein